MDAPADGLRLARLRAALAFSSGGGGPCTAAQLALIENLAGDIRDCRWVGISRFGSSHDRPSPGRWDDTFQEVPGFIGVVAWNWARTISPEAQHPKSSAIHKKTPANYPIFRA